MFLDKLCGLTKFLTASSPFDHGIGTLTDTFLTSREIKITAFFKSQKKNRSKIRNNIANKKNFC